MYAAPLTLAIAGLLVFTPSIARTADDTADELKQLAGRYETTFTNNAGTVFRIVMEIDGDKQVATTYDDVGNVVIAHTATIKVEKRGPVRVFSYFNVIVLAGPHKGEKHFETVSYIYRADDKSFTEVWGMLENDPSAPRILIWKRLTATK
ncbi:MAG TPA: hypothetical protein VGI40_11385 [Pirellulaceae bacterium]|jgi:hypothetical protein